MRRPYKNSSPSSLVSDLSNLPRSPSLDSSISDTYQEINDNGPSATQFNQLPQMIPLMPAHLMPQTIQWYTSAFQHHVPSRIQDMMGQPTTFHQPGARPIVNLVSKTRDSLISPTDFCHNIKNNFANVKSESHQEARLRFKEEQTVHVIQDPSISRDLSPLPMDRKPTRSCLKKPTTSTIQPEAPLTYLSMSPTRTLCINETEPENNNQHKISSIEQQMQTTSLLSRSSMDNKRPDSFMSACSSASTPKFFLKSKDEFESRSFPVQPLQVEKKCPTQLFSNISISNATNVPPRATSQNPQVHSIIESTAVSSTENPTTRQSQYFSVYETPSRLLFPNQQVLPPPEEKQRLFDISNENVTVAMTTAPQIQASVNSNTDNLKKEIENVSETDSQWKRNFNQASSEPQLVDYWEHTSFKRRNRRCTFIKEIMEMNERETRPRELIKAGHGTLLVVEICRDQMYSYAKCYTAADINTRIVIVPLLRFPTGEVPPLASMFRTSLQMVRVESRHKKDIQFGRIAYTGILDYLGSLNQNVIRRTLTFGTRGSTFYSEMLQIYMPLKHTLEGSSELLSSPSFGDVAFNGKVLPRFPIGNAFVEGNAWVEPKPGNFGVIREERKLEPWLLAEPFIQYQVHAHFLEDPHKLSRRQIEENERKREIENKEKIASLLKMRNKGYTMNPRDSKRDPKDTISSLTKDVVYDKRKRRVICEKLILQILERGTNFEIFHSEKLEAVLELVTNPEKKGTRLGQLGEMVLGYIKDEPLFEQLKKNEPENLEDLRLILKWTIDYAKGGRTTLGTVLYDFVFPLEEDPFVETDID